MATGNALKVPAPTTLASLTEYALGRHPARLERVIAAHPAVAMVAVGRVPDAAKGELAKAYVVLRAGATATAEDIVEHCRGQLAAYKLPRLVRFVADLPKTSTGKILRRELATLDAETPD